jgi:protein-S-isoprenylcysteine O-methyltransferase Ste14
MSRAVKRHATVSRPLRWLLLLYPRPWRDRYGREVVALAAEQVRAGDSPPRRAAADLARGAAVERGRVLARRAAALTAAARGPRGRAVSLAVRHLVFAAVVPGLGGFWLPWRLLTRDGAAPVPSQWAGIAVIAAGIALYAWSAWNFAAVGRGTPGPWDAPARVVAVGPYRWVRNPIYVGALLVVLGEAWLFLSPRLLAYAAVMAVFFHLFVTGYEERVLARRFGRSYLEYRRTVPRWIIRPPDGGLRGGGLPGGGATGREVIR